MNHQKEHGLKYQKLKKNEFSKNGHNSFLFSSNVMVQLMLKTSFGAIFEVTDGF